MINSIATSQLHLSQSGHAIVFWTLLSSAVNNHKLHVTRDIRKAACAPEAALGSHLHTLAENNFKALWNFQLLSKSKRLLSLFPTNTKDTLPFRRWAAAKRFLLYPFCACIVPCWKNDLWVDRFKYSQETVLCQAEQVLLLFYGQWDDRFLR